MTLQLCTYVKIGWMYRWKMRRQLESIRKLHADVFKYEETKSLFSSNFMLSVDDINRGHTAMGIALKASDGCR